jgi:hypothetical protein
VYIFIKYEFCTTLWLLMHGYFIGLMQAASIIQLIVNAFHFGYHFFIVIFGHHFCLYLIIFLILDLILIFDVNSYYTVRNMFTSLILLLAI